MNSVWRSVIDKDEEETLRNYLDNGHFLLDKLSKICYNSIIECEKVSVKDYDHPSWSHKQAHVNGKLEALNLILKLIDKKD
jgi:hypothetical protein